MNNRQGAKGKKQRARSLELSGGKLCEKREDRGETRDVISER